MAKPLSTSAIKDTVNEALRQATTQRAARIAAALDVLGEVELSDARERGGDPPDRHKGAQDSGRPEVKASA